MSDVLPSIIVLAITALLVFPVNSSPLGPRKAPPRAGATRRSKTQHSARSSQVAIAKAQRHAGHFREASTAFSEACTPRTCG